MAFIKETEKSTLKFIWKHKRSWIAKAILCKKEQCWRYHDTWLKLYYKAIAIKTAWYWHKNRHEDQWNRIEDPDMNPHNYTQLYFWRRRWWRKDSLFNKNCLENWLAVSKKLKLDPCLSPCIVLTQNEWWTLILAPKL
jgi:hypothetical protein